MTLADAVDSAQALLIGGVVEILRVVHAGVRRCQGDAGPGGVDLAYKDHGGRVGLELLDDVAPQLLLDVPVDGHRLHPVLAGNVARQLDDLHHLRDEPGEDDQLFLALHHVVLEDVGQGVQLAPAHQLGPCGIVLYQEPPGELLEPEQLGEDCGGRDGAATVQLGETVPPEFIVDVPLLLAEGDVPVFKGLLRQVEGLLLGHPVGDAVFLLDQGVQVAVLHDLLTVEPAHHTVPPPEGVEIHAEDGGVEETILAEDVHRLVLHRGAGEDQLVPGLVPQLMHSLALGGIVGLDALALIGDDQVGVIGQEPVEDVLPPGGLVIDDGHLQCLEGELVQVIQCLDAGFLVTEQHLDGVLEIGVVVELLRPDGADAGGRYDQHLLDLAHLVPGPDRGDGRQGLA